MAYSVINIFIIYKVYITEGLTDSLQIQGEKREKFFLYSEDIGNDIKERKKSFHFNRLVSYSHEV